MGRTVIVSDVHGCRAELDALLDKLAFSTGDRLVFVGDLLARGPDSLGVLDIARRTGAILVRGNHEEKLLAWQAVQDDAPFEHFRPPRRRGDESLGRMHLEIAEALRPVDWTLLATSPLYYELPEHGLTVVHAGVLPGLPVDEQDWETLLHIRCITPRGAATSEKGGKPWGASYEGPTHIVYGHNALPDPQYHPWATGIDTACVYGGRLTAMVLQDGDVVPRGKAARELLAFQHSFGMHYDWQRKKKVA